MMSKCTACGTSWTSLGMPMCPICGAKVHDRGKIVGDEGRTPSGMMRALGREYGKHADHSSTSPAVLVAPAEMRKPDLTPTGVKEHRENDAGSVVLRPVEQPESARPTSTVERAGALVSGPQDPKDPPCPFRAPRPAVKASVPESPRAAALSPKEEKPRVTAPPAEAPPETPPVVSETKLDPASSPEKRDFAAPTVLLKRVPLMDVPKAEPEASKATRRLDASETPTRIFPKVSEGGSRKDCPVLGRPSVDPWHTPMVFSEPVVPSRSPQPSRGWEDPREAEDASVVLGAAAFPEANLPSPARPLNGPLILGSLALVTVVMLPLAAAFESTRVFGILGFCLCGFFLPFSPIAWIVGLSAEKRRREQGLRPEKRVVLGRLLGQWATLLLVAEGTVGLLLVAALRLGGKFPATFWSP